MYAKLTEYSGILVFQLLTDKSIPGEVVASIDTPNALGQVILSPEKNLGISSEALALCKTINETSSSLGDIDFFFNPKGTNAFCWLGGQNHIADPAAIKAARNTRWDLPHITIPNEVHSEAMLIINQYYKKEMTVKLNQNFAPNTAVVIRRTNSPLDGQVVKIIGKAHTDNSCTFYIVELNEPIDEGWRAIQLIESCLDRVDE